MISITHWGGSFGLGGKPGGTFAGGKLTGGEVSLDLPLFFFFGFFELSLSFPMAKAMPPAARAPMMMRPVDFFTCSAFLVRLCWICRRRVAALVLDLRLGLRRIFGAADPAVRMFLHFFDDAFQYIVCSLSPYKLR